ncbi:MAG TPA: TGS domain-containing protein, partial [Mesotoga sp.]|nr:TGS domain-containing protein [Mesotoga sp.]
MGIEIKLPDGSKKQYEKGARPLDIAMDISEGLAKRAFGAIVNDEY